MRTEIILAPVRTAFNDPYGYTEFDGLNDGTPQYIQCGPASTGSTLSFERTDSFSFSLWVNGNDMGSGGSEILIGKQGNSNHGYRLFFSSTNANNLRFSLNGGSGNELVIEGDTHLNTGTWYHLTVTYNGNELPSGVKMYVNGVADTMNTRDNSLGANTILNTNPFEIGAYKSGQSPYNGYIDEVSVYNRVLTAAEIAIIHSSGRIYPNIPNPDLVSNWKLDSLNPEDTRGTNDGTSYNMTTSDIITVANTSYALVSPTLDLDANIPFSLNYQVDDIRNISSTNSSYSKTITIPGTKNNNIRLGGLFDINSDFTYFNPNIKTFAKIVIDYVTIMDGYFQLKKINKDVSVDVEGEEISYEIIMFENTTDFFTDITDKYLIGNEDSEYDLDFSDLDHILNYTNVTNAFSNTWEDSYCMFVGDKPSTEYRVDDFKPAFFYKKYIEMIGEKYGYTFSGSFIDDVNFAKEIIPYNGPRAVNDEVTLEQRQFKAGITGAPVQENYTLTGRNPIDTFPNGVADMYDVNLDNDSTAPYFDNNNNYDTSTDEWTVLKNGTYSLDISYQVNIAMTTGSQEAFLVVSEYGGVLLLQSPQVDPQRLILKVTPLINGVESASSHITTGYNSGGNLVSGDDIIPNNENGTGGAIDAAFRASNSYTRIIQTTLLDNVRLLDNIDLRIGDVVTVKYGLFTKGNVVYAEPTLTLPVDVDVVIAPEANVSFIMNTADDYSYTDGDTVYMNRFVPKKTKVSSLFEDIQRRYNLLFSVDPEDSKNILVESRDDYYTRGDTVDWTNKVDFSTISIDLLSNLQDKKVMFSYKADKDYWNEYYTNSTTDVYGQKEIEYTNEFTSKTKEVMSPMSPTPMIYSYPDSLNARRMMVPSISTHAPNQNIRVLYYQGLVDTLTSTFDLYDIAGETLHESSIYPCASTFNNNLNPTIDLNFGTNNFYYVGNSMTGITENNAYNRYWKNTIEQIAEGKIINVLVDLNIDDISKLRNDLNTIIFIKNTYYYINKISDYTLSEKVLTKVELLKMKPFAKWVNAPQADNSDLTFGQKLPISMLDWLWYNKKAVENGVTVRRNDTLQPNTTGTQGLIGSNSLGGAIQTSPEAQKNQILSSDAIVTGEKNLVAPYTENTIISGNENLVESNTRNSGVLGGDRNTIEAGLTGAWAIGVSDKRITQSNEIWLGETLHIIDGVIIPVFDIIDGGDNTLLNEPNGNNHYEIIEGGADELRTNFPENPEPTIIDGNT